eukprot:2318227-Rhodomonas_salina.7
MSALHAQRQSPASSPVRNKRSCSLPASVVHKRISYSGALPFRAVQISAIPNLMQHEREMRLERSSNCRVNAPSAEHCLDSDH